MGNGLQSCQMYISRQEDGKEPDIFLELLSWLPKVRGNRAYALCLGLVQLSKDL